MDRVPVLWPSATVVVAASGPSLTRADLDYCRGRARLIVVNNTWQIAPWADLLYACDFAWWRGYEPAFAGLRVTQDKGRDQERAAQWARVVRSEDRSGFSRDRAVIHQGANSGFQAVNLAMHLGAARIVLLGFDLGATGQRHWHDDHPAGMNNPGEGNFARWRRYFDEAARDAPVPIINATRETALTCFPRVRLDEALHG